MLRQILSIETGKVLLTILCLVFLVSVADARDVQIEFKGIQLNGNLEEASGKTIKSDGVTIIVHETLAHGKTAFISQMQQGFANEGINSLAITLSLGLDGRTGNFDCSLEQNHTHEDGAEEIGAWVEWLAQQGVKKISLLGIERGGNQAELFIHQQLQLKKDQEQQEAGSKGKKKKKKDEILEEKVLIENISRLVMIMPIDLSPEQAYKDFTTSFNADLGKYLVSSQEFVEKQNEYELMEGIPFLECRQGRVTAATFINYHLPKQEHSLFGNLSAVPFPVLAMVGAADPQFSKFEGIVSDQLNRGVGQLAVARLDGLNRDYKNLPVSIIVPQAADFLKR